MNIVYVNDEDFERKVSRMTIAELERALQTLNNHVKMSRESMKNYPPEKHDRYAKPYIARYELRVAQVSALLRNRS